jgi:hypothetical protein
MEDVQWPSDVVHVLDWSAMGMGGHPEHGLDVDGNPDTCAPVGDCSGGVDNSMFGFFQWLISEFSPGDQAIPPPYGESSEHPDFARLVVAEGWNVVGTPFTLSFYLGRRLDSSCEVVDETCPYCVRMESMSKATCAAVISFDNAAVQGDVLTAGGAGHSSSFALVSEFPPFPPKVWEIPVRHVSLVARVEWVEGGVQRTQGILGAAINKEDLKEALKSMPMNPGIIYVVSPIPGLQAMVESHVQADVDTTGDGLLDSASIGILFQTTQAVIQGLEGLPGCLAQDIVPDPDL